ncbi:flippase [Candidatus Woesearchaeota archaeon]|nr:flippase [Candidatus Woesearchaeota archaeon]
MVNYTGRVLRDSTKLLVMAVIAAGLAYLIRLVLAKHLSIDQFGLFYSGFALISSFAIFRNLGMYQSLVRFLPELKTKKKTSEIRGLFFTILLIQAAISIVITLIFLGFSEFIQLNYFHVTGISTIIILFGLVFLLSFLEEIINSAFQGCQEMNIFSIIEPLRMVLILGLTVTFFFFVDGLIAPLLAYLITYMIMPIIFFPIFLYRTSILKVKGHISPRLASRVKSFCLMAFMTSAGGYIFVYTDTILLTLFKDLTQVGLYQAAVPTAMMILFLSNALSKVVLPFTSEMWTQKKQAVISKSVELIHKYSPVIMMPVVIVPFVLAAELLSFFFGEEYIAAALPFQILLIGVTFLSLSNFNQGIFSGVEKPKNNTIIMAIGVTANIVLNLIMIPPYGIVGAAIATSIGFLATTIISTVWLKKMFKFHIDWAVWIKTIIITLTVTYGLLQLKEIIPTNVFISVPIIGIACLAAYGILSMILGVIDLDEAKDIMSAYFRN